jgi:hypothetical protein
MIRKQFFIEEEQNARLKRVALVSGKSEAELIREGIDQRLKDAKELAETEDWKAAWRKAAGMWADYPEIDAIVADRRRARGRRRDRVNKRMAAKK